MFIQFILIYNLRTARAVVGKVNQLFICHSGSNRSAFYHGGHMRKPAINKHINKHNRLIDCLFLFR